MPVRFRPLFPLTAAFRFRCRFNKFFFRFPLRFPLGKLKIILGGVLPTFLGGPILAHFPPADAVSESRPTSVRLLSVPLFPVTRF